MHATPTRKIVAGILGAAIAPALAVAPVLAGAPVVETWTSHSDRPYLSCGSFDAMGVWDISHKLTIFSDASGLPIRDIERIDFRGAFVNSETGASVPDSGSITFFDTLASDGSYPTTFMNQVRKSAGCTEPDPIDPDRLACRDRRR